RALRLLDAVEDRPELVGGVLLVALDLELDERGVSALRDLTGVPRSERRLDVLNRRHVGNTRDDVPDRGVEGRRARSSGPALDQDALIVRQLEAGIQDSVHAARLAGSGRVRIDVLRADLAANCKSDGYDCEPTERRGLPVGRAPAAHPGCQVAATAVLAAKHDGSPFGGAISVVRR